MAPFDLKEEILRLKKERNAIILAHSYQTGDIQDMADYVGDSLGLAYKAQHTDCDVIAFCGVHFMAETAKILNPDKTVILPDADAGCSLEASCDAGELEAFLKENADRNYYVVAYVNCSIGVKALADVIVTSGNAVKIVSQAPEDRPILFVPDQNLGAWVGRQLGRPMELWNGACHVHMEFTRDQILALKEKHPGALVVAHPECTEAVRLLADHICSTEKMIPYCTESPASSFIIVTESGILHRLRKLVPGKEFIPAPHGAVLLQHLPVHEDEHAGKTVPGSPGTFPPPWNCRKTCARGRKPRCCACWSSPNPDLFPPRMIRLSDHIAAAGGWLSLEAFMQLALHHPQEGYYSTAIENIGSRGDFSTTPTLSPILAKAVAARWKEACARCGRRLPLLEIGAGSGALAVKVLEQLGFWNRLNTDYVIVESSPRLREFQHLLLGSQAKIYSTMEKALKHCGGKASFSPTSWWTPSRPGVFEYTKRAGGKWGLP